MSRSDRLMAAVTQTASVDEALARLATAFADDVAIARVSLRLLDPGRDELVMVSVWSEAPTRTAPGLRTSALSAVLIEARRYGRPVFSQEFEARPTVLGQVLRDEGIRSWVVIPLFRRGEVVALLGFASADPNAIGPARISFWSEAGEVLEGPLLDLALPPGGLPP